MPTRLARGVRVGDRYRLETELGRGTDCTTWEAFDERLDRPVALRIFDAGSDRKDIVKRAGVAASLTHPRVVRVFDTGEDSGRFFTVSEFVSESVATTRLPLAADVALQTATDIAEALQYAHERGVVHGHIHEANVLLSEGGAKVADFALGGEHDHVDKDDDLRSLGELMRRVARTPDPNATPGFSRVIESLANGVYTSAAEALHELRALRPRPQPTAKTAPRRGVIVVVALVLAAVAVFGIFRLGERTSGQKLVPGGRIEGTPLEMIGADDFDPFGKPPPASENPGTVRNAIDADPATFWSTEAYRGGANFSGLKPGVGLILDAGKSVEVGKAQILFLAQGCTIELRSSDTPAAPIDKWAKAATIPDSQISAAFEFPSGQGRYWLVWITKLAASPSGFSCGIKDARLFAP